MKTQVIFDIKYMLMSNRLKKMERSTRREEEGLSFVCVRMCVCVVMCMYVCMYRAQNVSVCNFITYISDVQYDLLMMSNRMTGGIDVKYRVIFKYHDIFMSSVKWQEEKLRRERRRLEHAFILSISHQYIDIDKTKAWSNLLFI